jgi:hypothetical protein
MLLPGQEPNDEEKAALVARILAGLGEAEIKIVASYATPLFWTMRNDDGAETMKGGTAFLLDTGEKTIAVTTCHVVEECFEDTRSSRFIQCMIGGKYGPVVPFHLGDRIIDAHHGVDIATFRLTADEIARSAIEILRGYCHPRGPLPQSERGLTYCGYPGNGRRQFAPRETSFGVVAMGGHRDEHLAVMDEARANEIARGTARLKAHEAFAKLLHISVIKILSSLLCELELQENRRREASQHDRSEHDG